jgi:hypothetical protein
MFPLLIVAPSKIGGNWQPTHPPKPNKPIQSAAILVCF